MTWNIIWIYIYIIYLTDRFHVRPQGIVIIFDSSLHSGQTRRYQVKIISGLNTTRERTERHVEPAYQFGGRFALPKPQTIPFLYSQHCFVSARSYLNDKICYTTSNIYYNIHIIISMLYAARTPTLYNI